jgi:hypothetical protein
VRRWYSEVHGFLGQAGGEEIMMEWIKTEDKLPECSDDSCSDEVIVCSDGEVITGMRYWKRDGIFMNEMDCAFSLDEISHWMPLPQPPEESE